MVYKVQHRDSQRRIYVEDGAYFITTITHDRYRYFDETILCELFVYDLWFAQRIKQFELHGYVVLPDHVHLLIQQNGKANISSIMHNIKRVFALHANQIMLSQPPCGDPEGDDIYRRLQWNKPLLDFYHQYHSKYPNPLTTPIFKWQKSFRDHIIRDEKDYHHHLRYIWNNSIKHRIVENVGDYPWVWIKGMQLPALELRMAMA